MRGTDLADLVNNPFAQAGLKQASSMYYWRLLFLGWERSLKLMVWWERFSILKYENILTLIQQQSRINWWRFSSLSKNTNLSKST